MRKSWLCGVLAAVTFGAQTVGEKAVAQQATAPARASIEANTTPLLGSSEQRLADRIAADFFENELRLSQSRRIEAQTAEQYRALAPMEKKAFREERRRLWRAFSHEQQLALRNVKRPAYQNLSEEQKATFRQTAAANLRSSPNAPDNLGAYGQDI